MHTATTRRAISLAALQAAHDAYMSALKGDDEPTVIVGRLIDPKADMDRAAEYAVQLETVRSMGAAKRHLDEKRHLKVTNFVNIVASPAPNAH